MKQKRSKPWNPLNRLEVRNKDPKYHYRYVEADDTQIERRLSMGYSFVNKETGLPGEQLAGNTAPGTARRQRELVLMALPKEDADDYINYTNELATSHEKDIFRTVKETAAKHGSSVRAKLTIE